MTKSFRECNNWEILMICIFLNTIALAGLYLVFYISPEGTNVLINNYKWAFYSILGAYCFGIVTLNLSLLFRKEDILEGGKA